jgi:hypothetical protein
MSDKPAQAMDSQSDNIEKPDKNLKGLSEQIEKY